MPLEIQIKSPYKKSGMSNQKAAFLKNIIKNYIIDLPHSSEKPFFKLIQQESFEGFTWCSCKSDEEHKAKWEAWEKSHPPQPFDFQTIKNYGYNGSQNTFIHTLNLAFDKNVCKKRKGRPTSLNEKYLPITQEDKQKLKTKCSALVCDYLRIKEKNLIKFFEDNIELTYELVESAILTSLPSSLKEGLTETQFRRSYRMIIKRRWFN